MRIVWAGVAKLLTELEVVMIAHQSLPKPAPRSTPVAPARKTILVIDDDEVIREVVSAFIGDQYEVLEAGDALSGLAIAERRHPDLILLDFMMPRIDGEGFLNGISANARLRATPVVLLTCYPVQYDERLSAALRPWRILQKPVLRETLLASIAHALRAS